MTQSHLNNQTPDPSIDHGRMSPCYRLETTTHNEEHIEQEGCGNGSLLVYLVQIAQLLIRWMEMGMGMATIQQKHEQQWRQE